MTRLRAGFEAMRGDKVGVPAEDFWFIYFYPMHVAPLAIIRTSEVVPAGTDIVEVYLHVAPVDPAANVNIQLNLFICEDRLPAVADINRLPAILAWGQPPDVNLIQLAGESFDGSWRMRKRIADPNKRIGFAMRAASPTGDRFMVGVRYEKP